MQQNKAPGPSGIVAKMLEAARDIISLYKGKGDALERGNYRGLKLTDQVLKVVERIIEKRIPEIIDIDNMQFGFMPGRGTTDVIFIIIIVEALSREFCTGCP